FVAPHDPILLQIASPIPADDVLSLETLADVDQMLEVAYGEQKDAGKPVLVGLAAPQIGISKRIILVDLLADGKGKVGDLRVFINPEIVRSSQEQNEWYEGCFSTGRVCGIVSRPTKIRVRSFTREGAKIEEEYSGMTARIFQHEIDHLNGLEFVSHVHDDDKLHWVEKEEFPEYRDQGAWRNWHRKCSREEWNKIKTGR
ncbi:MAG: peptide deformylase, partial [Verrucomicrobia bacterium]|nr:peptide deformylase [Verrucomicrobiota bacterium]